MLIVTYKFNNSLSISIDLNCRTASSANDVTQSLSMPTGAENVSNPRLIASVFCFSEDETWFCSQRDEKKRMNAV
jgi:hypothetical protein